MITTENAIMSLRPNIEWTMIGDNIEEIIWHTPDVDPLTIFEVQEEIQRLESAAIAAEETKIAAKESAILKLSELGLNYEEVEAIMGGI